MDKICGKLQDYFNTKMFLNRENLFNNDPTLKIGVYSLSNTSMKNISYCPFSNSLEINTNIFILKYLIIQ